MELNDKDNYFLIYMNNKAKSTQQRKKQAQIANVKSTSISIIPNKTALSINNNEQKSLRKKDNDAKIDRLQVKISNIISLIDSFKKEYITAFDNDIKSKKESLHLNQTNTNANATHHANQNSFVCFHNSNKEQQLRCCGHNKQRKSNSMINNVKCNKDKRNTVYKQLNSISTNRNIGKNNTVMSSASAACTKKFNGVKDKELKHHSKNDESKGKAVKAKKMFATVDVCLKNTLTRRTAMNVQHQTQKSFNSFNTHIKHRNDNNLKNISSKTKAVPISNFNKKLAHNSADKTKHHHKCKSERIENVFSYKKLF